MASEGPREDAGENQDIEALLKANAISEGNLRQICIVLDKIRGPFQVADHDLLQKVFKCLQTWSLSPGTTSIIQGGILPTLARIYDDLIQSDYGRPEVFSSILELVFIVEDLSESNQGKVHCGRVFLTRLLALATAKAPALRLQRAAVETICALVTKSPENQEAFLDEKAECYKLFRIFLPKCGDFQLQISITEIFYRLLKKGPQLLDFIQDKLVRESIETLIQSKQLNLVNEIQRVVMLFNESLGSFRSVYSFLTGDIVINGRNMLTSEKWIHFGKSQLSFHIRELSDADPEQLMLMDVPYDSVAKLKRSSPTLLEICIRKTADLFPLKAEGVNMMSNFGGSNIVQIHISFKSSDLSRIETSVLPKIRGWSIAQLAKMKPPNLSEKHGLRESILESSPTNQEPLPAAAKARAIAQSSKTATGDLKLRHEASATGAQIKGPVHPTEHAKLCQVSSVWRAPRNSKDHTTDVQHLIGDGDQEDGCKDSNSDPNHARANEFEQVRPSADCIRTGSTSKERGASGAVLVRDDRWPSDATGRQTGTSSFNCHSPEKIQNHDTMTETRDVTFELRTKRRQDIYGQASSTRKLGPSQASAWKASAEDSITEPHSQYHHQEFDEGAACKEIPETPELVLGDKIAPDTNLLRKSSREHKDHVTTGQGVNLKAHHRSSLAGVKNSIGVHSVDETNLLSRSPRHRQCKKMTKYFDFNSESESDTEVTASAPSRSRGESRELRGSEYARGISSESTDNDVAAIFPGTSDGQKCNPGTTVQQEHQRNHLVPSTYQRRPGTAKGLLAEINQNCSRNPQTPVIQRLREVDDLHTQENVLKDPLYCMPQKIPERESKRAGKENFNYYQLFGHQRNTKRSKQKKGTLQQQSTRSQGLTTSGSEEPILEPPKASPGQEQMLKARQGSPQEAQTSTSEESEKIKADVPPGKQRWRSFRMRKLELPEVDIDLSFGAGASGKKKSRLSARIRTSDTRRDSIVDGSNLLGAEDDDLDFVDHSGIDNIENLLKGFKRKVKSDEKRKIDDVLNNTVKDLRQEIRLMEERARENKEDFEEICKKKYEQLGSKLQGHSKKLRVLYDKFQQDFAEHLLHHEDIFSEINDSETELNRLAKQRAQEREDELVRLEELCQKRLADAKKQICELEEGSRSLHGLKEALKGILPDLT